MSSEIATILGQKWDAARLNHKNDGKNKTAMGATLTRAGNTTAKPKTAHRTEGFLTRAKNFIGKLLGISIERSNHTNHNSYKPINLNEKKDNHHEVTFDPTEPIKFLDPVLLLNMAGSDITKLRCYAANCCDPLYFHKEEIDQFKSEAATPDSTMNSIYSQILDTALKMNHYYNANEGFETDSAQFEVFKYIDYIMHNMNNSNPLLTADEFIAINIYVHDENRERINSDLRNNEPLNVVIDSLQRGLKKLSDQKIKITYSGTDDSGFYSTAGEKNSSKNFTSTTSDINSAFQSAKNQISKNKKIEYIFGKNSATLKTLLHNQNQLLNIYPSGSTFTTVFRYDSPATNNLAKNKVKEAKELIAAFYKSRENIYKNLPATILEKMMNNNVSNQNNINTEITEAQQQNLHDMEEVNKVLNDGVSFVVLEEAGLPPTVGSQDYVEALTLAKLGHPGQEQTKIPAENTKPSQLDFLPGVGPLEGSTRPTPPVQRQTRRQRSGSDEM